MNCMRYNAALTTTTVRAILQHYVSNVETAVPRDTRGPNNLNDPFSSVDSTLLH